MTRYNRADNCQQSDSKVCPIECERERVVDCTPMPVLRCRLLQSVQMSFYSTAVFILTLFMLTTHVLPTSSSPIQISDSNDANKHTFIQFRRSNLASSNTQSKVQFLKLPNLISKPKNEHVLSRQMLDVTFHRPDVAQTRLELLHDTKTRLQDEINSLLLTLEPQKRNSDVGIVKKDQAFTEYTIKQESCPLLTCPTPDRRGRYWCIRDLDICDDRGIEDCPNGEDQDPSLCLFHEWVVFNMRSLFEAVDNRTILIDREMKELSRKLDRTVKILHFMNSRPYSLYMET